jgi:hypothetical protein
LCDGGREPGGRLGNYRDWVVCQRFGGVVSVVMFGGGMKRGFLYGETAPERPLLVTRNPVPIRDLHATVFTAMGISPRTSFDIERRPFYATEDGRGQPVQALFA